MTTAMISAIVPVYNGERYIQETLESIFAQTYRPLEIIVIDDGSTDRTPVLVERYHKKVRYVRHDNCGVAATRNRGATESTGDYIAFLDSDDLWHKEKLEKQITYLNLHSGLDLCVTHTENFWSEDVPEDQRLDTGCPDSMPGFSLSTLMATRYGVKRVGNFNPQLNRASATEWFLRARDMGLTVGVLPEILVRRRLHMNNITRTKPEESQRQYLELIHQKIKKMRTERLKRS